MVTEKALQKLISNVSLRNITDGRINYRMIQASLEWGEVLWEISRVPLHIQTCTGEEDNATGRWIVFLCGMFVV
jgi:hypothetical protein